MNAKHTPTPWRVEPRAIDRDVYRVVSRDGSEVADVLGKHEALRIVRAVNAQDALVAALRGVLYPYGLAMQLAGQSYAEWEKSPEVATANAALRLAEGGQS